jgi:hypothetical protein
MSLKILLVNVLILVMMHKVSPRRNNRFLHGKISARPALNIKNESELTISIQYAQLMVLDKSFYTIQRKYVMRRRRKI